MQVEQALLTVRRSAKLLDCARIYAFFKVNNKGAQAGAYLHVHLLGEGNQVTILGS